MKTIIAVTFFGIFTYAFAEKLKYGEGVCQNEVDALVNLDAEKFFKGTWYLTHSTPSTRVTESTICRDYKLNVKDGKVDVTYGYYENGVSGNRYDIECIGVKDKNKDLKFDFECSSKNARGESSKFHVDAYFVTTDYDTYGVVYRCATTNTHIEDNVFLVFRQKDPSDDKVQEIKKQYGLENLISRKDAACNKK